MPCKIFITFLRMIIYTIFDTLKSISIADIIGFFLNSNFFYFYFIVHAIYVCYYMRMVAPIGGLHPFRSYTLGFILAYSPRFFYGRIVHSVLPELEDYSVIYKYTIVWISLNLVPFDLVFSIVRIPVVISIVQILSFFGISTFLNNTMYTLTTIYPQYYSKVLFSVIFCFSSPCFLDFIDSILFGSKRNIIINRKIHFIMLYPFHWIKRVSLLAFLQLVLSQPQWILPEKYTIALYSLNLPFAIITGCLSLFDIVSHHGNMFFMFDFIFPKPFNTFITYYPSVGEIIRRKSYSENLYAQSL